MNALKRLFVFVVNLGMWLPRFVFRAVWWLGAVGIAVLLAVAYVVALPFLVPYWLLTHPVFFNIFRFVVLVVLTVLMFVIGAEGDGRIGHLMWWFGSTAFVGLFVYALLFHKKSVYQTVTQHHRPFVRPSRDIKTLLASAPSLSVPFAYLRFDPPPVVHVEPDYYAQVPSDTPQSVEKARQDVPEHLRELMK